MPLTLANVGEESVVHNMPQGQQRWYPIKIFECDNKILAQLSIDKTVLSHIEDDINAAEKELVDDAERIINNERYILHCLPDEGQLL